MLKPKDLEEFLRSKNIDFKLMIHEESTYSAGKASEVLGVNIDDIIKSLLFINEKDEPILVIVLGNKRVNQNKLAKALGFKKLRLARPDEVLELTGYEAGGLPPVFHKNKIRCIIDKEVLKKEFVYGGGGTNNATLKIRPKDIVELSNCEILEVP